MFAGKGGSKMKFLLLVGAGSFIGGVLRYLMTLWVQSRFLSVFPFGTLAVNVVGCFAIGLIFGFAEKTNLATEWRLFLATGICGGFTTFSAFSNETLNLIREEQYAYALIYIVLSVIVGLLATFLGYALARFF